MRWIAVALACSAGCAQLFGIEETSSGASSTLELQRVSVGAMVATAPLDLAAAPSFLDATGTTAVTATSTAAGQWSAPVAMPLAAVYTAPDLPMPFQHALELGVATQRASFVAFEHPSPQPAPASTVMVNVTLPGAYASEQTLQVLAVGAWTSHLLAGAELPAVGTAAIATTIPYASFQPVTASPAARITAQDVVVVLRYTGPTLTGQLIVPAFDQSTTSDTIMGTMAAVTPAAPFDAMIDPATAATRLAATMPASTTPAFRWELDAMPGYSAGALLGVRLDGASLAMTDTSIAKTYANPFLAQGWGAVLTYEASASRTYMIGTTPVALAASLAMYVADPQPGLVLDLPAALPKAIALAGQPLAMDGMTVTLDPTQPADVEVTIDNASASSVYAVTLEEIALVGGTLMRTPVVDVAATGSHLVLPPNVLQPGHTYTLIASCVAGGYPNAASGDVQTFSLPASVGTASSAVFTVSP
ncbi:MAG: hypothetical protein ACM31C_05420 [Acidobacteriota bacterium]